MGSVRSLLALLVVLGHIAAVDQSTKPILSGGAVIAVQLFFVISGFYMALVLDQKYRTNTFAFYRARALRLYPLYFVTLAVTLLVDYLLPDTFMAGVIKNFRLLGASEGQWLTPVAILSNLTFLGLDLGNLVCVRLNSGALEFITPDIIRCYPLQGFTVVPQAWSLGAEVLFYLIIPFIFRLGWRGILAALLLGLISQTILYVTGLHRAPWDRMLFLAVLTYFMLGFVAYRIYAKFRLPNLDKYWPAIAIAVTVGLGTYVTLLPTDEYAEPTVILIFTLILPFLFHASKNARIDSMIGELSYPIYITHLTALAISISILKTGIVADSSLRIALHLALVLALAGLGVWGVTLPMERIRGSFAVKPKKTETSAPVPKPAAV